MMDAKRTEWSFTWMEGTKKKDGENICQCVDVIVF